MKVNTAVDLLNPGESAIVLFTRGLHFDLNSGADGEGWSGYWPAKPSRNLNKVIIYNRPEGHAPSGGDLYVADFLYVEDAVEEPWRSEGRIVIHFRNAELKGTTEQNWHKFADTGTRSFRYVIRS